MNFWYETKEKKIISKCVRDNTFIFTIVFLNFNDN